MRPRTTPLTASIPRDLASSGSLAAIAGPLAAIAGPLVGGRGEPAQAAQLFASHSTIPVWTVPTMLKDQLSGRGITDVRVLEAMEKVPRHEFVPKRLQSHAYLDQPLPIGFEQTISQPFMVAYMTQLVRPQATGRALDVGAGSGYQAAVLAELTSEVYSMEIIEPLALAAAERLNRLGYQNVHVRCGNGYEGWPEEGPYDCIIVAAAADHVPQPLIDQLAPGGRMAIPVGQVHQVLQLVEKLPDGTVRQEPTVSVAFVPMTGDAS